MNLDRPSWSEIYLGVAHVIAERSHDLDTKVGCVITSPSYKILGTGYNGFPYGISDEDLPRHRPNKDDEVSKYDWVLHAEENAVLNCNVKTEDMIAYVTTIPCFPCLKRMWQFGVTTVFYSSLYKPKSCLSKDLHLIEELITRSNKRLKLIPIDFTGSTIHSAYQKIVSYQKRGV